MIRHFFKLSFLAVSLFMTAGAFAAGDQINAEYGVLAGQFMKNGKTPLANGRLFIYNEAFGPASADRYVRVPDGITELDEKGNFSLNLPPGTYYLSAVVKANNGAKSPPTEGEPIYFKTDSKGNIQPFIVNAGKETNTGIISSSFPYKRKQDPNDKRMTRIDGIVKDPDGAPVEGAVIYAYATSGILDKPLYIAEKTAKDGRFSLQVSDGGTYFLRIRGDYGGGTPKDEEIVNADSPDALIAVTVKKGETLTGLTLQAKRLKRGPLYKGDQ